MCVCVGGCATGIKYPSTDEAGGAVINRGFFFIFLSLGLCGVSDFQRSRGLKGNFGGDKLGMFFIADVVFAM